MGCVRILSSGIMRVEGRVALVCSTGVKKNKKIKELPELIGEGVKLPPPVLSSPPLVMNASPFFFLFYSPNCNCVFRFHTKVRVIVLTGVDASLERQKSDHSLF